MYEAEKGKKKYKIGRKKKGALRGKWNGSNGSGKSSKNGSDNREWSYVEVERGPRVGTFEPHKEAIITAIFRKEAE